MTQTLALLHTSQIFFTRETMIRDLLGEILPDVKVINILDDSLLSQCVAEKKISPDVVRRICSYIVAAEEAGADAVLSLCSTVGPAIDVARKMVRIPVIKIDDAHTEKAVIEADRIGVLATVATTLEPTLTLIREKAVLHNRQVEIHESLADAAFEALTAGDRNRHDMLLVEAAKKLASRVDLILFAQASMTRLAHRVEEETGLPVLTSPRLAIEYMRRVLDSVHARPARASELSHG